MSTNRTIVATAGLVLAFLVLVGSVSAAPSISLSSTSGDVGDTVTITGTGFNATENVSVWLGMDQVERIWSTTNKAWENITYPSLNATMNPASDKYYAIADAQGFWKLKYQVFAPENWYDMNQTVDVTVEDANGNQIGAATPYTGGPDGVVFNVNTPVVTINTTSGDANDPIQINVSNLRRNDQIDAISFGIGREEDNPLHPTMADWNEMDGNWGNVTTPNDIGGTWVEGATYTVTVQILKNGSSSLPLPLTCSDTFTYTGTGAGGPWMWLNATRLTGSEKTGDWGAADVGSSTTLPNINSFDGSKYGELYPLAFRVANFSSGKVIAANSITVGGVSTTHGKVTVGGTGTKTNTTFYPVNLSGTVSLGPATVNIGGSEFTAISSQPYANTTTNAGISLSTSSGSAGDIVQVYGYGFDTNINGTGIRENITLLFSNTPLDVSDQGAGTVLNLGTGNDVIVDSRGAFAVNFTVPSKTAGKTYTVYAFSNLSVDSPPPGFSYKVLRDQASFTIPSSTGTPTITLNKTQANVGDKVGIKFANFGDAEKASVTMDGTTLNSSMFTSAGYHEFTVPTKSGGTYTITAENTTESKTATATFTIVPEVTDYIPGDTSVYAGDSYELRGTGFVSGTRYAILWNPAENGGEVIGDFYATSTGKVPDDGTALFTIPASSNGKHLIDVATYADQTSSVLYGNMLWGEEPEGSAFPNQNFTGATYFQAAPLNPAIGDTITITGSNLDASDVVTMTDWNGVTYNMTADASGTVTKSWTVPYLNNSDLNPGMTGPLTFVGQSKDYGAVNLLVYDNVDLSKTSGSPGEQITVTGDGFKKNTQYYIFLNQSSTGTDSYVGQFTATGTRGAIPTGTVFTVPTTLDSGSYRVLILDRNTWPAAGGKITNHDIPTFTLTGALDHITVTPETASLEVGGTQSFTCTGYDTGGNVVTVTPTWSVDNSTVGTINTEGLFVANENGTATVTATVTQSGSTYTDTATVTVGGAGPTPSIDSIVVSPSTWTMQVGEEKAMTAMGYSGTTPVTLTTATWSSDDTSIATVTGSAGSGTVTGAGQGTATISVTQEGVTGTATLNVYTDITDAYKDASTGKVEKANAVQAVNDYLFNDKLSKTDAVTVVNAYLFG